MNIAGIKLLRSSQHQNLAVILPKTVTETVVPAEQTPMIVVAIAQDPEKEATVQMTRKGKLLDYSNYPNKNSTITEIRKRIDASKTILQSS